MFQAVSIAQGIKQKNLFSNNFFPDLSGRCAAALSVVLRVLEASLAASRSQLSRHLQDRPLVERTGQLTSEAEREELRVALVATQESVAMQILLEACLLTEEDKVCM